MTVFVQEKPRLDARQHHGRAVNAVAEFLRYQFPKLNVPNIYIEPKLSLLPGIDVLAIDRAGSGDLLAVEIKGAFPPKSTNQFERAIEQLKKFPAHFKYLAIQRPPAHFPSLSHAKLFAEDGIGRVGILFLDAPGNELPKVTLFSPGERFKIDGESLDKIEKTLAKRKPDIEVRV